MKPLIILLAFSLLIAGCKEGDLNNKATLIGEGEMPNVCRDNGGNIQLVYGMGDQIMYAFSSDKGKSFSNPSVVSMLPELAASHMRGPQIAASSNGLVVTACTKEGDIFSFVKENTGGWVQSSRINDVDTVAKENLMALSADGLNVFAIWQDMRDGQNKIFGARSKDGGKSWSKNILVYASPEGSVCECCKPSVLVKADHVFVMFRNLVNGNRDMYLVESSDNGDSFGQAQKIGSGSWALNGCPMDGGALAMNDKGNIETVWRRKSAIYSTQRGKEEKEIGEGKSCTMESVNGKNVFAWTNDGNVIILSPQGMKKDLGEGSMPVLKAINNEHVLCVWEKEKKIYTSVVEL